MSSIFNPNVKKRKYYCSHSFEFMDYDEGCYASKQINNQKACIYFEYIDTKSKHVWYVTADIFTKRKHRNSNLHNKKSSGKCGLDALIWFKQKIQNFESFMKRVGFTDKPHAIVICWTDSRRRDIYHRGLKNIGYEFGYDPRIGHFLGKVINI